MAGTLRWTWRAGSLSRAREQTARTGRSWTAKAGARPTKAGTAARREAWTTAGAARERAGGVHGTTGARRAAWAGTGAALVAGTSTAGATRTAAGARPLKDGTAALYACAWGWWGCGVGGSRASLRHDDATRCRRRRTRRRRHRGSSHGLCRSRCGGGRRDRGHRRTDTRDGGARTLGARTCRCARLVHCGRTRRHGGWCNDHRPLNGGAGVRRRCARTNKRSASTGDHGGRRRGTRGDRRGGPRRWSHDVCTLPGKRHDAARRRLCRWHGTGHGCGRRCCRSRGGRRSRLRSCRCRRGGRRRRSGNRGHRAGSRGLCRLGWLGRRSGNGGHGRSRRRRRCNSDYRALRRRWRRGHNGGTLHGRGYRGPLRRSHSDCCRWGSGCGPGGRRWRCTCSGLRLPALHQRTHGITGLGGLGKVDAGLLLGGGSRPGATRSAGSPTTEIAAYLVCLIVFDRGRVGLLFRYTNSGQRIKNRLALDFKFPRQIINPNFAHPFLFVVSAARGSWRLAEGNFIVDILWESDANFVCSCAGIGRRAELNHVRGPHRRCLHRRLPESPLPGCRWCRCRFQCALPEHRLHRLRRTCWRALRRQQDHRWKGC